MSRIKWFPLIAGIITLIIGLFFFIKPITSISIISWLIVLSIFFSGVTALIEYILLPSPLRNIWSLIQSIITIVFSVIILITPMASLEYLIVFVAYWVLLIGILRLIAGFQINRADHQIGTQFFTQGTITIIIGVLLLSFPLFFTALISKIIGVFIIFLAVILFSTFYRLNRL